MRKLFYLIRLIGSLKKSQKWDKKKLLVLSFKQTKFSVGTQWGWRHCVKIQNRA